MKILDLFKRSKKTNPVKLESKPIDIVVDTVRDYLVDQGVELRSKEEAEMLVASLTGVDIPSGDVPPELVPLARVLSELRGIATPSYKKALGQDTDYINEQGLMRYRRPYSREIYDVIDRYVLGDRFFGKAHESAIKLANTDFVMLLPDSIDKKKQQALISYIYEKQYEWFIGGFHTLQSALHSQILTAGAIAIEAAPNRSRDKAIIKLVEPKTIELFYDEESESIRYFQDVNQTHALRPVTEQRIELNPKFFRYIPSTPLRGNLYGIPTFMKAIDSVDKVSKIATQADVVIDRYSILGVITAMVNPPARLPREGQDEYNARVEKHLQMLIPTIIEGYRHGILVGINKQTEYQATNVIGDISSFKDLYREFKDEHIAALGSYSLFFNKLESASDAVISAIKQEYAANIDDNTKLVIQAMEFVINMAIKYSKFSSLGYIQLKPKASVVTDKLRAEQARAVELTNAKVTHELGYLSQTQAAQSVGISVPYEDEPLLHKMQGAANENGNRDSLRTPNSSIGTQNPTKPAGSAAQRRDTRPQSTSVRRPNRAELVYDDIFALSESCDIDQTFTAELGRTSDLSKMETVTNTYVSELQKKYDTFMNKVGQDIKKAAQGLDENDDNLVIRTTLMEAVYNSFEKHFDVKELVDNTITSAYTTFVNDDTALRLEKYKRVYRENKALTTDDIKFMAYFKSFDKFYLTKILYDSTFLDQIDAIFDASEVSLSKNLYLEALLENIKAALDVQKWKITRVAATTINRLRNIATLSMFNKSNVQRYKIVEVMDGKTCGYCQGMHNKEFQVSTGVAAMKEETKTFSLNSIKPFLTNLFKKPEQMPTTASGLAEMGVVKPPFHPYCRGVIIPI